MENRDSYRHNTFLYNIASYLNRKYPDGLDGQCILFPNRRAGLFFKKYYAEISDKSSWLPEIFTMSDFMNRLSGLQPADPLELSFDTYRAYKKLTGLSESFDEFYPWGEMMISDFNDVDKYFVDAEQLFSNINDLKEIEQIFDYLDDEQKQLISRFWKNFERGMLSDQKESFLFIWKILFPVYEELKKNLLNKELGYEGMIYRRVVEDIISESGFTWQWDRVHICGFNALSKAEERLFSHLKDAGKASFFWDYDTSFISDPIHEAGRFLRKNIHSFPGEKEFTLPLKDNENEKDIRIFSLPSDVLQTKQLHEILDELNSQDEEDSSIRDFNRTAVILGDETLLSAVLTSIPKSTGRLNITMGYPLSQTPVYSFIESVLKMQQNFIRRKNNPRFYFRDIISVLNHQYIKTFYLENATKLLEQIHHENKIYLDASELNKDELFELIFRKLDNIKEVADYLHELLGALMQVFPREDISFKMEKEYIFHIRTRLNKLFNLLEEEDIGLSMDAFIRLFRKVLSDFRIPFEGEPLQGVQFMGILESRLLDFKNLIFLSMNEGIMPASGKEFSYIPANLRYAFGMPVREDKDAIYAYYFYRLLKRANSVNILYNSKTEGVKSGEPTRYIHQLRYLGKWNIKELTRSFSIIDKETVKISVEKDSGVMEILEKFTRSEYDNFLSPSALLSYLDCPLKFYFSYVAGIKEEDEVSEEIDASGFGSLYHKTMELIYRGMKNLELHPEDFNELLKDEKIKPHLDQAFREEFLKSNNPKKEVKPEGKNIIIYEIINKLVKRTLEIDQSAAPFIFHDTEQKIDNMAMEVEKVGNVHLGGLIDRMDFRKGVLHVIDYKTGKVNLDFPSVEKIFDRDSWSNNDNFKGVFQIFMYSWLYLKENPGEKIIRPAIYQTRELFKRDFSIYLRDKSVKKDILNFNEYLPAFEENLRILLSDIFNPEISFNQTEDEQRCRYCPYKEICHRG